MHLIRTRLTWQAYLLNGFFTFIISIQGNIIPFLRDELRLSYAAVSLHPSALAAGMMATGLYTERVLAAIGRRWTCLLGVAGCIGGLLAICAAGNAASSIAGCALVGLRRVPKTSASTFLAFTALFVGGEPLNPIQ